MNKPSVRAVVHGVAETEQYCQEPDAPAATGFQPSAHCFGKNEMSVCWRISSTI
jgi:hypothetical protein